jgi:hypothetical protein
MDADDISLPDRLIDQFNVFHANSDVGVVGCLAETIDSEGRVVHGPELWKLARRSWLVPFAHGSTMYRRQVFDQVGGYRRQCDYWEDQDVVMRMAAVSSVMVIPRVLYRKRESPTSIRSASSLQHQEDALDRMYASAKSLIGSSSQSGAHFTGHGGAGKVDPRVFVSLGSVALWSGNRPGLFGRLLRRGRLRLNLQTAGALGWTAWASASPGSLRALLNLLLQLRNSVARRRIDRDRPVEWSLPRKAVAARRSRR